jgi:release factor glutamine methyltransferase
VFFEKNHKLSSEQYSQLLSFIERAMEGEPISKITKSKEFYGISYVTNEHTMDPRPETELIIDLFLKNFQNHSDSINILDLGSGTGCISLTLLSIYKNSKATLLDIDKNALEVSQINARNLSVYDRCDFVHSDWFSNINKKFEVIVTNPPYVSTNYDLDRTTLYDPHRALFAGIDGLDAYRQILPYAYKYLKNKGKLFVEIGVGQKESVLEMANNLLLIHIENDISQITRYLIFEKRE